MCVRQLVSGQREGRALVLDGSDVLVSLRIATLKRLDRVEQHRRGSKAADLACAAMEWRLVLECESHIAAGAKLPILPVQPSIAVVGPPLSGNGRTPPPSNNQLSGNVLKKRIISEWNVNVVSTVLNLDRLPSECD